MSGPLVRSSYRAGRLYAQAIAARAGLARLTAPITRGQSGRRDGHHRPASPDPRSRLSPIGRSHPHNPCRRSPQNWSMTQTGPARPLPLEVGGLFARDVRRRVRPDRTCGCNWLTALILALPMALLAAHVLVQPPGHARGLRADRGPARRGGRGHPVAAGRHWLVTPAVAVNKSQDIVTRVVGRPGVVLVAEGPSSRVVPLLANERKRTARWLPEVPIYEIQVGNDEGQVPLRKLQKALSKLPRTLRGGEITEIRRRLKALGNADPPCRSPRARCRPAPVRCAAALARDPHRDSRRRRRHSTVPSRPPSADATRPIWCAPCVPTRPGSPASASSPTWTARVVGHVALTSGGGRRDARCWPSPRSPSSPTHQRRGVELGPVRAALQRAAAGPMSTVRRPGPARRSTADFGFRPARRARPSPARSTTSMSPGPRHACDGARRPDSYAAPFGVDDAQPPESPADPARTTTEPTARSCSPRPSGRSRRPGRRGRSARVRSATRPRPRRRRRCARTWIPDDPLAEGRAGEPGQQDHLRREDQAGWPPSSPGTRRRRRGRAAARSR